LDGHRCFFTEIPGCGVPRGYRNWLRMEWWMDGAAAEATSAACAAATLHRTRDPAAGRISGHKIE